MPADGETIQQCFSKIIKYIWKDLFFYNDYRIYPKEKILSSRTWSTTQHWIEYYKSLISLWARQCWYNILALVKRIKIFDLSRNRCIHFGIWVCKKKLKSQLKIADKIENTSLEANKFFKCCQRPTTPPLRCTIFYDKFSSSSVIKKIEKDKKQKKVNEKKIRAYDLRVPIHEW